MRLSPSEPAQLVLNRLRASEPRRPTFIDPVNHQPHVDPTFEARHTAWRLAVEREEVRLRAEQEGKLEAHLDNIKVQADGTLALRQNKKKKGKLV